jgi:uncharacterized SAM-binding protein YcdF (DUF218 family)
MIIKAYLILTVILWIILLVSFVKERSRYRNCYLLFAALLSSLVTLTFLAGEHQKTVLVILVDITFIVLLIVPAFLIMNGIYMLLHEGRSLGNLLSLAFGLLIGFGEVSAFMAVLLPEIAGAAWEIGGVLDHLSRISMFFAVSVVYISASFFVFMVYCVFLQIIPRKRDFDYVIIHGAGLLDGDRVSKLLSDRIDKAIEIYRKDPTPPVLIPSGGQGDDERISEAEAMKRYLLNKGIPEDKILIENRSMTTLENLKYSKEIIDSMQGRKYTALVTSNYHVYRALRYCRKIGLKCVGIGSHVAFYYWPSALIREYIAVHSERKHLIIFLIGWLACLLPFLFLYFAS